MICDWCGMRVEGGQPGWDGKTFVCSQGCHEHRKLALSRTVGMGPGLPHTFVPPADPARWGAFEQARAERAERSRAAGLKSQRKQHEQHAPHLETPAYENAALSGS